MSVKFINKCCMINDVSPTDNKSKEIDRIEQYSHVTNFKRKGCIPVGGNAASKIARYRRLQQEVAENDS